MKKFLFVVIINFVVISGLLFGFNCFLKYDDNQYKPFSLIVANCLKKLNVAPKFVEKTENFYISKSDKVLKNREVLFADDKEAVVIEKIPTTPETFKEFCGEKRFEINPFYKKNPIVTLGCSYVYGHGLDKTETLPYLLSNLSERPVYNLSYCGGDGLGGFDVLANSEIDKTNIKNADYYVYVYMYDHFSRYLQTYVLMNYYDELFEPKFFERKLAEITVFRYVFSAFRQYFILKNAPDGASEKYFKNIFKLICKKIQNYSPHAKLIVVIYDEKLPENVVEFAENIEIMKNDELWQAIEEENDCVVVHSEDLVGFKFDKNYKLKKDISPFHPNAQAWTVFAPKFKEKFIKN